MRNEIKKYYQTQFGLFPKISAKEIAELNSYELQLLELPPLFYSKANNSKPELRAKFQKLLAISKN